MYILRNALRSILQSKGRNILIGIIVLVIAFSSCVALSIRQAAEHARENSMENLEVTAQITVNRQAMMSGQQDKESMKQAMANMEGLSIDDMKQYADNSHVKGFYYTASTSFNAGDGLEAVDTTGTADSESEDSSDKETPGQGMEGVGMPGDTVQSGQQEQKKDMGGRMGVQGDFTVTGYSSDEAMISFINGTSSIIDGSMFAENDVEMNCVVSEELAAYNQLSVGDTITLANPNNEEETYQFTISGIYKDETSSDSAGSMMSAFSAAFDSANQIYTSYANLQDVVARSEESAAVTTDGTTGVESTTALRSQENGTYTFASVDEYQVFKEETEAELGDYYTVTSADVSSYEQSLQPLENLSRYAGYFLVIILGIGGVILIVMNLFNIRERKYEIGVLAAIGMKKWKIAVQFILELLCVTFAAIIIGAGAGTAVSVPVTNQLLAQQIESTQQSRQQQTDNFGRGAGGTPEMGGTPEAGDAPDAGQSDYISQISSATDITVVLQLIGIGIILTIISGCAAVISILRYEPLRILSNRE